MAFEETKEQQQMYNYFRSCIYIFLIIEIVMNLPITADNRITQFILDLLGRFKVFNSVAGCKVTELVCICVVCIGTKAKKCFEVQREDNGHLSGTGRLDTGRALLCLPWDEHFGVQLDGLSCQPHSMRYVLSWARCWCIRDWMALPSITTIRWAMTASTSRTNRSNSRRLW